MKFMIRRTSGEEPPCPKAKEKDGEWYIKIKTLEELIDFVKENGEVVLDENRIEIYDDYRE